MTEGRRTEDERRMLSSSVLRLSSDNKEELQMDDLKAKLAAMNAHITTLLERL